MAPDLSTGLYIHIPFCRRRCRYCAFYSAGESMADWKALVSALLSELNQRKNSRYLPSPPHTLYIGGGTPSLLPEEDITTLLGGVFDAFGISPTEFPGEVTLEVNPEDVTVSKVKAWKEAGVNRVSMGVQSLCDDELKAIGRRHSAEGAVKAFNILRPLMSNISLDVMFGLPYQTEESLRKTLTGLIELHPEHISAYSLTYEERTPLYVLKENGTLPECDEAISVDMYRMIHSILSEAGYNQYEISNYSLPGYRSRHNSSYWNGSPYLGLGPSAHSYDGKRRRSFNLPDIKRYMAEGWSPAFSSEEHLSEDELREEMLLTRLRTAAGLDLSEYEERFGETSLRRLLSSAESFIRRGTMLREGGRLYISGEGFMVSDDIISSLF